MGSHSQAHSVMDEKVQLGNSSKRLGLVLMIVGLIAVVVGFVLGHGTRGYAALLFAVCAFLSVSCSALVFVLINHLVRAGWITNVRRILETLAMQVPLVGLLLIPVVIATALTWQDEHGDHKRPLVYSWAVPEGTEVVHHAPGYVTTPVSAESHSSEQGHSDHSQTETKPTGSRRDTDARYQPNVSEKLRDEQIMPGIERHYDELIHEKRQGWLQPIFWTVRVVVYLTVLSLIGWYFYSRSVRQDVSGDPDISMNLMQISGPFLIAAGLIVTFIAFDVFMTLDPHWFSTMFGVYFFATGTQAMWAFMILICLVLQSRGYLTASVNKEHYHDMGKFMFAFVVFFAYIAFSQYMLQWYANLPEETFWYDKRGYSTMYPNGYSPLVLILLIGRFVIPFLGLVSRHVKRNRFGVGFWAVWLILCFLVDVYLIVIPEFSREPVFGLPEILCLLGAGALWMGNIIRMLASHALRPIKDPRVHESLAIQNF
ncbi:MAG: hypothetical protein KatS3mg104_2325 [Phycisphaerae bacterium]|nr:MAG: hypothetical protein KatS3mg104_2325 [Phycisphaerae bacterium]